MRLWRTLALLGCALFLTLVARFYHPGLGFSALLMIPEGDETYQLPALRDLPLYKYPKGFTYDGAMYVQLAMTPLLSDPAIDRALDAPVYRARRIFFCWTAYVLGLGRPAWIVQAYALQNVACWLMLAWFITRWFPLRNATFFALWAGSMFSHGLLTSARLSVLDGPSLLLLAVAAAAAERHRTWLTSGILGIAALGRETSLLGAIMLPWPRGWRGWLRAAGACGVVVLPLLIWQDYLWAIYRGTSAAEGAAQITVPLAGYLRKWTSTLQAASTIELHLTAGQLLALVSITVQAVYIAWTRKWSEPWWKLAAAFAVLMLCVDWAVWEGYPGAITRVTLPLKFGFNVLLARDQPRAFWAWFVPGNLDVAFSQYVFTT